MQQSRIMTIHDFNCPQDHIASNTLLRYAFHDANICFFVLNQAQRINKTSTMNKKNGTAQSEAAPLSL